MTNVNCNIPDTKARCVRQAYRRVFTAPLNDHPHLAGKETEARHGSSCTGWTGRSAATGVMRAGLRGPACAVPSASCTTALSGLGLPAHKSTPVPQDSVLGLHLSLRGASLAPGPGYVPPPATHPGVPCWASRLTPRPLVPSPPYVQQPASPASASPRTPSGREPGPVATPCFRTRGLALSTRLVCHAQISPLVGVQECPLGPPYPAAAVLTHVPFFHGDFLRYAFTKSSTFSHFMSASPLRYIVFTFNILNNFLASRCPRFMGTLLYL